MIKQKDDGMQEEGCGALEGGRSAYLDGELVSPSMSAAAPHVTREITVIPYRNKPSNFTLDDPGGRRQ